MEKTTTLQERLNSLKGDKDSPVTIITQREAVMQNKEYIRKKASGELVTFDTCYERLNKAIGGIEANTMMTISALSGGGKSTLAKRLVNSIVKNLMDKGKECMSLSFNFEMLAHKTVGREVANMSKVSLKELYSSEHPLSSSRMEYLFNKYYKQIIDYPILYVEEPAHYTEIGNAIYYYWKKLCKDTGTYMIVEVDHAVITRGKEGEDQKAKIDGLMETLNRVKKKIANEGGNVFYIILSQMNREIKDKDRMNNPSQHYPLTSDLFASSSIEFFSDYILISHMPAKLNLKSYTDNKLPVYLKEGDIKKEFIYWHLLKNRDGEPDLIIPMLNNLRYFDFEEIPKEHFAIYHEEFSKKGSCDRINQPKLKENNENENLDERFTTDKT